MFRSKKPVFFLLAPMVLVLVASLLMWALYRRQEAREEAMPGFGVNASDIRQASADAPTLPAWKLCPKVESDARSQLDHARELCRESRMDKSLCAVAEQELTSVLERSQSTSDLEEALYLKARYVGMWGAARLEDSVALYQEFTDRFPESERMALVCYELALTYDEGLHDLSQAAVFYRRAASAAPDRLPGMLAAKKLENMQ